MRIAVLSVGVSESEEKQARSWLTASSAELELLLSDQMPGYE